MKNILALLVLFIVPFVGISQSPTDPFMRQEMMDVDDGQSGANVDPKTQLCSDFNSLAYTVKTFSNLDENSKIEQYKNIQKLVDQSWNRLKQSSAKVPAINIGEIEQGYDTIKELVSAIDVTTNVVDAAPKIANAVDETLTNIEKVSAASCH